MARFGIQKLPPHWVFVPSKHQVRELVGRLKGEVRVVEYGRTEPHPKESRVSLGFLESRVVNERWCFFLRLWGVREDILGIRREELGQAALAEIEGYIRCRLRQRPAATIKPAQLYLSFTVGGEGIRSTCRAKIKDKYSFSTGDWWLDPVQSPEHTAQPQVLFRVQRLRTRRPLDP